MLLSLVDITNGIYFGLRFIQGYSIVIIYIHTLCLASPYMGMEHVLLHWH